MYEICPSGASGIKYTVFCDQVVDGGGWMLMMAYQHTGGENNELVEGNLPTDPNAGYGHVNIQDLGYTAGDIDEVRFYCETSAHTRKMHFKTSNSVVKGTAYSGSQVGNNPSAWKDDTTLLSGHTAHLPLATGSTFGGASDGFWNFPFWLSATYHWGVRGLGHRWECDNYVNSHYHDTLHQVWVRMA